DATLIDMCNKMPSNDDQLLMVSGVGESKMKRYGEAFLEVIKEFIC
ncbi:MAG: HRDC domain-containing protein, partial [Peptostreptococcaceae bacterium]|nr:HRDC domain-containing protein [Peptostreptococcaceae bacterium]